MDDILSQIIAYAPDKIDTEIKAKALVQGSRNMDQEPRIPFGDGLSVDPERDSFKKISNVIGAYNRYRRGEKNPVLNFNQFFELYSTENFATGGSAGQLVQPNADGSRPGYSGTKIENNIRLRDNGKAYDVEIQRGPQTFRRSFNLKDYKNKTEALNAAKKYKSKKIKIPFKTGIQDPQIVASSREEYNQKYRESKGLTDPTGKMKKAKEKEIKIKNFIGDKKKIKASVLKDFMLNEVGFKNYDAADVKKYFPNLEIEKDNTGGGKGPRLDKNRLNIANRYANLLNKRSSNDPYYVNSKKYAELSDGEKARILQIMKQNDGKFNKNFSSRLRFNSKKEKLIMESFGLTENDFIEHGRTGVPQKIDGKLNPEYTKINKFISKGFKFDKIKKSAMVNFDQQEFIKNNFELPEGKEWNFKSQDNPNGYKYGVAGTKDSGTTNLAKRIENRMSNKNLSYTVAADTSSPKGWMMNAMNRLYEREIENKVKPENLTYKPIKKNGIIIGFTDTTAAGGNKNYYGLKKNTPEDATPWAGHGDFNRVSKFIEIADGVKAKPDEVLQKLLDEKGISKLIPKGKRALSLNDVLSHQRYYKNLSDVAPSELIKRQVVLHHQNRIGSKDLTRAAATKDIQLLTGAVNNEVRKLETIASKRKLTLDEKLKLKNYGARIQDFDGKVVGGGYTDPTKQFAGIEKKALEYAKGDQFNVKTVASYLERLGCGQAAGGRILFADGVPGLTKCAKKGVTKLENGLKSGFKNADDAVLARGILKSSKFLKEAVSLRGLFGPAALAFTVAAEAGIVGYDMLTSGKSFKEAIGSSLFNYALGDKTKIDSDEEFIKRLKNIKVGPQGYQRMGDEEIGKMLNFKANLDDMKRGFGLYSKLEDLEGVQEVRDEKGNVIVKGKAGKILDNQTNQAIGSEFFSDNAFNLDAERDAIRADIQDYNRTNTPNKITDYLLSPEAKEGADATALANLLVSEDQLKNAGTGDVLPKVDQGIARNLKQTQYDINNLLNPKKLDEFGEYFMSLPKGEQSTIMSYGYPRYMEGGIVSLNVNKK